MTTKLADCSTCNGRFGSTIDNELMKQVVRIRNMLRMESGSGKAAPARRGIDAGSDKINILGDGRMELVAKPFTVHRNLDGSYAIQIKTRSFEEAERLVPNIAAAVGIPEAELRRHLAESRGRMVEARPGIIHSEEAFGGPDAIRSMVKSTMCLWASELGNSEVHGEVYDAARRFIMTGEADFNITRTYLDARVLPCSDQLKESYGPLFNLIYVCSDASGRVIAHFTLYNCLSWQFILAGSGGSPNRKVALVSDPLNPKRWRSRGVAEAYDVPISWLDSPNFENGLEQSRVRLEAVLALYFERSREAEITRIVEDSFAEFGVVPGESLSPDQFEAFSRKVSQRSAALFLDLPYEEELTSEQMRGIFLRGADRY